MELIDALKEIDNDEQREKLAEYRGFLHKNRAPDMPGSGG